MSSPLLPSTVTAVSTLPAPAIVAARDAAMGRMIAMALRLEGYAPQLYTDGQQALEALLVEPCAAAILDAHLPTMDGLAISERMRASTAPVSSVPIILLLMEEDATTWQISRQHLQVDAVFFIPFQIRDLIAAVAAAIERRLPSIQNQADERPG
jgi:two-component system, OmpR family, response regulator ChvI